MEMEKEIFYNEVVAQLQEFYGRDAEIIMKSVNKLNNKVYTAVLIDLKTGDSASPVFYLDAFWDQYVREKLEIEDVVGRIIDIREKDVRRIDEAAKDLNDFEKIKDKIFPIVVSAEQNEELLKRYIFSKFLDMVVLYAVRLEEECGTVKITNELFEHYGISLAELHYHALVNMNQDGYNMKSMNAVIRELLSNDDRGEIFDIMLDNEPQMFILSNKNRMFGASAILNEELLCELAGRNEFYVIPSSIHELILVPASFTSAKELKDMVRDVNDNNVAEEERLTYSVYKWSNRKMEIAA